MEVHYLSKKKEYLLIGLTMFFITIACYSYVVYDQYVYTKRNPHLERLTILSTRSCFIFPGFALSYVFTLASPFYAYNLAQLPTSFVQAYCIFCYFGLIVYYCGGPDKIVEIFSNTTKLGPFNLFANITTTKRNGMPWSRIWYYRVYRAVWAFLFIRPYVVILTVIFYFVPCAALPSYNLAFFYYFTGVFSLIGTAFVAAAILSIFKTFHIIYDQCAGINAFWKLFLLKGIVGLILGQGFIEQVYYATLGFKLSLSDDDYQPREYDDTNVKLILQNIQKSKVYEQFTCVLLGELAFFSLFMCVVFTAKIDIYAVQENFNEKLREKAASKFDYKLSLYSYICKLLTVWDLFEDKNFILESDLMEDSGPRFSSDTENNITNIKSVGNACELTPNDLTINILQNDDDNRNRVGKDGSNIL